MTTNSPLVVLLLASFDLVEIYRGIRARTMVAAMRKHTRPKQQMTANGNRFLDLRYVQLHKDTETSNNIPP